MLALYNDRGLSRLLPIDAVNGDGTNEAWAASGPSKEEEVFADKKWLHYLQVSTLISVYHPQQASPPIMSDRRPCFALQPSSHLPQPETDHRQGYGR